MRNTSISSFTKQGYLLRQSPSDVLPLHACLHVLRGLRSEAKLMRYRRLEAKPWGWMPPLPLTSSCNLWTSSPLAPAIPGRSLGFPRCPACRECLSGQQVPASLKLALQAYIGKTSPS